MNFETKTRGYAKIINDTLETALVVPEMPKQLAEAVRYSINSGGKRLRPCLTLGVSDMLGGNRKMAIRLGCGIEMIHNYSLIHDDLPCMDNDDMRRGRPSNHKVFGEAQALLAGDALLTYAFQWMLEAGLVFESRSYYNAITMISRRAGISGMVAGQSMDIAVQNDGERGEEELLFIQRHKTADMITASVLAGAYCAEPTTRQFQALERYGERIGLLFQMVDDILDYQGTESVVGKTLGKDEKDNKLTFVTLYGLERTKDMAREVAAEADKALKPVFGSSREYLHNMIHYIMKRKK